MFELTGDDIALLGDEDLRTLVAHLCESELRSRGVSPDCVTSGGNQNAPDGGVDVRVSLPPQVDPPDLCSMGHDQAGERRSLCPSGSAPGSRYSEHHAPTPN